MHDECEKDTNDSANANSINAYITPWSCYDFCSAVIFVMH